jgi:hypothetical protein
MDDPFSRMQDPAKRAERYRKVAAEYYDLAKEASSPSLRAYFQRVAEEYRVRAQGELRVLERGRCRHRALRDIALPAEAEHEAQGDFGKNARRASG